MGNIEIRYINKDFYDYEQSNTVLEIEFCANEHVIVKRLLNLCWNMRLKNK